LPGEKISLKNGKFTIKTKDGKEITLDETYVIFQNIYKETNITLKNDEYFVSGDNRAGSYDSRDWGPLKEKEIIGKPFIRLFRLNTIGFWPGNFDYEK
jgi:signal peptidase I